MKVIFSGLESSGKSLLLARTVRELVYRNAKWLKVTGVPRPIRSNIRFASHVVDYAKGMGIEILYWKDLDELLPYGEFDLIIDEVGTYFDSRKWADLSLDVRRWIAQGAKAGIEMYGTAQDFAQTDKSFRRLTSHLFLLRKIIGSGDISPTRPAPRWIWGIVVVRELDPTTYDEQKSKFGSGGMIPSLMYITRKATEIFNTRAEVRMSSALPLKHIEKECENIDCAFHKTVHV